MQVPIQEDAKLLITNSMSVLNEIRFFFIYIGKINEKKTMVN